MTNNQAALAVAEQHTSLAPASRLIPLTQGQFAKVSAHRFDEINAYKWGADWSSFTNSYYAVRSQWIDGRTKRFKMHREILGLTFGDKRQGDHRNLDTLDNTDENLRIATRSQNAANSRRSNHKTKSGVKGVFPNRYCWKAQIRFQGKTIYLGNRRTIAEAAELYRVAAAELHKEFAKGIVNANALQKMDETALSPSPLSPMSMIQLALSSGTAPEVIRELVALQQSMERFNWEREERQAKIAFDEALNECQRQVGRVAPNVNRKDTNSWWADYMQLDAATRPIYTRYGFSISFSEVEPITPGKVRIKASLSRSGVSKDYFREITPSTTGPKGGMMATATDADAIAGSRAKRYLLLDIFNIAVGIDKEEKKGIPHEGMQPELLKGWIEKMRAATDPGQLAAVYREAYTIADRMADKAAMFDLIKAHREEKARYKE